MDESNEGSTGDRLIAEVLASGDDDAAYSLLQEYFDGYPIESLRKLFASRDERVVKAGAWLASELGRQVGPLMEELGELAVHSSSFVRFFVLDSILLAATGSDGRVIARAVQCISDGDRAVRWKTLMFLSRALHDQLEASMPYLRPELETQLAWLLASTERSDQESVLERLSSNSAVGRLVAVAAAARIGRHHPEALRVAVNSDDPEVRTFAQEEMERLGLA